METSGEKAKKLAKAERLEKVAAMTMAGLSLRKMQKALKAQGYNCPSVGTLWKDQQEVLQAAQDKLQERAKTGLAIDLQRLEDGIAANYNAYLKGSRGAGAFILRAIDRRERLLGYDRIELKQRQIADLDPQELIKLFPKELLEAQIGILRIAKQVENTDSKRDLLEATGLIMTLVRNAAKAGQISVGSSQTPVAADLL